jgi:hypothetical protein
MFNSLFSFNTSSDNKEHIHLYLNQAGKRYNMDDIIWHNPVELISQVEPSQLLRFFAVRKEIRQFDLFDLKPTENHFKYTDAHSDLMDEIKYFYNDFEYVDVKAFSYKSPSITLMKSIRDYDTSLLNKIEQEEELPITYMQRLKNTLEMNIVETRIKELGRDPGFSFTTNEYKRAMSNLIITKNRESLYANVFFGLIGIVGLCSFSCEAKSMSGLILFSSIYNFVSLIYFSF